VNNAITDTYRENWCPEEAPMESSVCRSNPPESISLNMQFAHLLRDIISLRRTDARGNVYYDSTGLSGIVEHAEKIRGALS